VSVILCWLSVLPLSTIMSGLLVLVKEIWILIEKTLTNHKSLTNLQSLKVVLSTSHHERDSNQNYSGNKGVVAGKIKHCTITATTIFQILCNQSHDNPCLLLHMFNNELTSRYKISNSYVHAWNTIKPNKKTKSRIWVQQTFTPKIEIRGQVEELNNVSSV
jgi:hypothetical protein